jgi:hypothetical protein
MWAADLVKHNARGGKAAKVIQTLGHAEEVRDSIDERVRIQRWSQIVQYYQLWCVREARQGADWRTNLFRSSARR